LPTLAGLEAGTLKGRPQDEAEVTYAAKLTKEMEVLEPALGAEELGRRIRALNPWPGTSLWVGGKRLKIKRAVPRVDIASRPGELFERNGMLLLGCARGALELQLVQWDGKKEMDAGAFLNGLRGRGEKLPLQTSPTVPN
jgi:methionyl-tRNA formyltransferase